MQVLRADSNKEDKFIMTKPLLVQLCEKYEEESGRKNRISQLVLEAYNDSNLDLSKLQLAHAQSVSLLCGGYDVEDPVFDRQIKDDAYLNELREAFRDHKSQLKEAGPWTSNLAFAEPFTGRLPMPYARLIPEDTFEGAQWRAIVEIENVENFKLQSRLKLEDLARYARVPEGGEYNTSPREGYRVFYRVAKYGLEVALTWEMIVNDDMNAFNNLVRHLVLSGVDSINATVWGAIVANPIIWNGNNLFHLNNGNLMGLALSIAALGQARWMMNRHTTPGGKPISGVTPRFLIVPPELEQTADVILKSSGMPTAQMSAGVFNPEQGRLTKLVTAYLTDPDDWYLWCTPDTSPVMEVGFLFGRSTPETSQKDVWESEEVHYRGKYAMGYCFKGYRGALLSSVTAGTS